MELIDDQVAELSAAIDKFLYAQSLKYELHPISLSAYVNARLYLMNEVADSVDDFKKLMGLINTDIAEGFKKPTIQ